MLTHVVDALRLDSGTRAVRGGAPKAEDMTSMSRAYCSGELLCEGEDMALVLSKFLELFVGALQFAQI